MLLDRAERWFVRGVVRHWFEFLPRERFDQGTAGAESRNAFPMLLPAGAFSKASPWVMRVEYRRPV